MRLLRPTNPLPTLTRPPNAVIRDNHYWGRIGGFLEPRIRAGSQMSVVSAYFIARVEASLRQCDALEAQLRLAQTPGAHLLDATLQHALAA